MIHKVRSRGSGGVDDGEKNIRRPAGQQPAAQAGKTVRRAAFFTLANLQPPAGSRKKKVCGPRMGPSSARPVPQQGAEIPRGYSRRRDLKAGRLPLHRRMPKRASTIRWRDVLGRESGRIERFSGRRDSHSGIASRARLCPRATIHQVLGDGG